MRVLVISLTSLLLAGVALAADDASREKLTGQWQQTDGSGDKATWTLKDSGGSIHLTSAGEPEAADFDCNTLGKECAVKVAGHKAKVSIWFNGAMLVELETTGGDVVKRRFKVTGDGDTMELETIAIAPAAKDETTHFKRIAAVASK